MSLLHTAEGAPSREFWKAIYKPAEAYGTQTVTGWIADLFPYLRDPPLRRRNGVLDTPRVEWMVPINSGIPPTSFPSGFSTVPVHLKSADGATGTVELMAGFFAVGQNSQRALYPVIGWAAVQPDSVGAKWDELAKRFPSQPRNAETEIMQPGRDIESNYFAGRYSWIDLTLAKRNWRIVPDFAVCDPEEKYWLCFAYDCDAIARKEPGRVLGRRGKAVHLCTLEPGFDPEKQKPWLPQVKPQKSLLDSIREMLEASKNPKKPIPQIAEWRLVGGDLFEVLSRLVEYDGELPYTD